MRLGWPAVGPATERTWRTWPAFEWTRTALEGPARSPFEWTLTAALERTTTTSLEVTRSAALERRAIAAMERAATTVERTGTTLELARTTRTAFCRNPISRLDVERTTANLDVGDAAKHFR